MSWATLRGDALLQLVVVEEIDAAFLLLSEVISAEKPDSLQRGLLAGVLPPDFIRLRCPVSKTTQNSHVLQIICSSWTGLHMELCNVI